MPGKAGVNKAGARRNGEPECLKQRTEAMRWNWDGNDANARANAAIRLARIIETKPLSAK